MSLVELMVAAALLAVFATAVMSSAILSRRISESNVYQNTAFTVAQGYLEQIKSMEYGVVLSSHTDNSKPLPTKSVSALLTGANIEVDDPITIGSWTEKEVLIDLRYDEEGGEPTPLTMPFRVMVETTNLDTGSDAIRALEVVINYEYLSPSTGMPSWYSGAVRSVKSYAPTF